MASGAAPSALTAGASGGLASVSISASSSTSSSPERCSEPESASSEPARSAPRPSSPARHRSPSLPLSPSLSLLLLLSEDARRLRKDAEQRRRASATCFASTTQPRELVRPRLLRSRSMYLSTCRIFVQRCRMCPAKSPAPPSLAPSLLAPGGLLRAPPTLGRDPLRGVASTGTRPGPGGGLRGRSTSALVDIPAAGKRCLSGFAPGSRCLLWAACARMA
mmetsp:Transcript_40505/g.122636  ORF Transcript_40505/g.122636 Transcript_40505/m.122636 type:complete len:220 (+) Transcript_40505:64-723(+)